MLTEKGRSGCATLLQTQGSRAACQGLVLPLSRRCDAFSRSTFPRRPRSCAPARLRGLCRAFGERSPLGAVLRIEGELDGLAPHLRRLLRELDPTLPAYAVRTLDELVARALVLAEGLRLAALGAALGLVGARDGYQ